MISNKESIARLVYIAKAKGVKNIVFSPGSRNAPLILSFGNDPYFNCLNIADERVAAFFAMGMALRLNEPVIICCTSGSAVLNYAPAISEAYYQKIPLIVITADRPTEWIDQRAGQTMRQRDVYTNYIRKSFELIEEPTHEDHLWYNDRLVNEAFDLAYVNGSGPVHINVPLKEPLYELKPSVDHAPKIVKTYLKVGSLSKSDKGDLIEKLARHQKILVLCGQHQPDESWQKAVSFLAGLDHVTILSETTSNLYGEHIIPCIDRTIDHLTEGDKSKLSPTLLITAGASIVSKKIRFLLRDMSIDEHWHIDPDDSYIDTYQALTCNVPMTLSDFVDDIGDALCSGVSSDYRASWQQHHRLVQHRHHDFVDQVVWSDFQVVSEVLHHLPRPSVLHMANSTSVRYVQLFDNEADITYQCNRGVSGIDGCSSTAAGYAYVDNELNTLITGDIAFFYDSNALWHHHLTSNLKIIILNNEGGNIFRVIAGPDKSGQLEKHFEAHHTANAKHLAATFGIDYLEAHDKSSLQQALKSLYANDTVPGILEVFTPRLLNDKILKDYFSYLRSN